MGSTRTGNSCYQFEIFRVVPAVRLQLEKTSVLSDYRKRMFNKFILLCCGQTVVPGRARGFTRRRLLRTRFLFRSLFSSDFIDERLHFVFCRRYICNESAAGKCKEAFTTIDFDAIVFDNAG